MEQRLLYHWSPTRRRSSIRHRGLQPGSWSTDGLWRPPYVCFAESPSLAWALSGMTGRGQEIARWDLWMMHFSVPTQIEKCEQEYRVFEPIVPEDLWFVGTRGAGV